MLADRVQWRQYTQKKILFSRCACTHTQCSWEISSLTFLFLLTFLVAFSRSFARSAILLSSHSVPRSLSLFFFTYLWIWWLCCCFCCIDGLSWPYHLQIEMRSINEALQSIPNKLVAQDVQAGILNNIQHLIRIRLCQFKQAQQKKTNSQQKQWQKNETPHK